MNKMLILAAVATLLVVTHQMKAPEPVENILSKDALDVLLKTLPEGSSTLAIVTALLQGDYVSKEDAKAIYDAFDQLLAALQKMQKDEVEMFAKVSASNNKLRQRMLDGIQELNAQHDKAELDLSELKPERKFTQEALFQDQQAEGQGENKLKDLAHLLNITKKEADRQTGYFLELIRRIDTATEIVGAIARGESSVPAQKTALVQLHDDMMASLDEIKHIALKPMVAALLQITMRGNEDNAELIGQILELLAYMRSQLDVEVEKLNKKFKPQIEFIQAQQKQWTKFRDEAVAKGKADSQTLDELNSKQSTSTLVHLIP